MIDPYYDENGNPLKLDEEEEDLEALESGEEQGETT